jgi:hypothetical protein
MPEEYVGSRQEYVDQMNEEWWSDDPGLGPYEVRCPECSEVIPDVLMCSHDHEGPLCPGCCENQHPHQCRACNGTRCQITGRDAYGYPTTRPCPTCNGTGRVNEETSSE